MGCIIFFASPSQVQWALLFFMQLVQFLLKQAGVDKRTGDLYGNRDLLNIARNMARGLKVCIKVLQMNVT